MVFLILGQFEITTKNDLLECILNVITKKETVFAMKEKNTITKKKRKERKK